MILFITTGQGLILALFLLAGGQILWVCYRAHKERLITRERTVQEAYDKILFENPREDGDRKNGFIFGSLWRLADIINTGAALGYRLSIEDCIIVVASIKHNFDPEVGISNLVIEKAVLNYMNARNERETSIDRGVIQLK